MSTAFHPQTDRQTECLNQELQIYLQSYCPYESRNTGTKQEGPFTIEKVMGPITYKLKLPMKWKIYPVFHAALLTPYRETDLHGPNDTRPPPDLIEGEEEYEVEAILAYRKSSNRLQYLVKWKGYDTSYNSWEPEKNLTNAEEILKEYKTRRKIH